MRSGVAERRQKQKPEPAKLEPQTTCSYVLAGSPSQLLVSDRVWTKDGDHWMENARWRAGLADGAGKKKKQWRLL